MVVPLTNYAGLEPPRSLALAAEVAGHTTLERVLDGRSLTPPRRVDEIVTQDEFTHDVVVAIEPPFYLVYDVT